MLNANITPFQFQSMITDCKELIAIPTSINQSCQTKFRKTKDANCDPLISHFAFITYNLK